MKPKVAFYWCASCGGCEEAVVDLAEKVLDVVAAVDIVFWPVALDFKKKDVEALEDGAILAAFVNGAVRTSEQEEMAHLLRRKAKVVVAFGACAQLGGIPGLANLSNRAAIFAEVYPQGNGHWPELPMLFDTVQTLGQTIDVDCYLPGCPPTPNIIESALGALLSGALPPKGSVLAPDRALCDECPRKDTRPEDLSLNAFHRPHRVLIDESKCILAQGVACLGPATRSGCGAQCVGGNMPCTGCFGPTSRVRDGGAKALSALASLAASNEEPDIDRILAGIPDPVGTFYRYSLPASSLRRKREETV
ncbi:MAG: oxidoreductase [Acidobacteria bacterium]|nr:oxidoreductase [Acidobacteriota bacterium]